MKSLTKIYIKLNYTGASTNLSCSNVELSDHSDEKYINAACTHDSVPGPVDIVEVGEVCEVVIERVQQTSLQSVYKGST